MIENCGQILPFTTKLPFIQVEVPNNLYPGGASCCTRHLLAEPHLRCRPGLTAPLPVSSKAAFPAGVVKGVSADNCGYYTGCAIIVANEYFGCNDDYRRQVTWY